MNICQLKITLQHTDPPVWRRVQVRSDIKLGKLHDVIQDVMGWEDAHLHAFNIDKESYGVPDPDFPSSMRNEANIRLDSKVKEGDSFIYEYDFGDSWRHEILIETVSPIEFGVKYPRCLAGERACPPEDCGGPPGYFHLLEAINDPQHPEHEEMREWVGDDFDPEYINLEDINRLL